jgi:hypothetical protein
MFVVIHDEGDCGCEYDPYFYSFLGIFNTKEEAEECYKTDYEKNKILREKKLKKDDDSKKLFLHYNTYIKDIQKPLLHMLKGFLYIF